MFTPLMAVADAASTKVNLFVGQMYLAQDRITTGEDQAAGNAVESFFDELGWAEEVLRVLGAILFVWLVVKAVWDRRRGVPGAGGIGGIIIGLFGLMVFFNVAFFYVIADAIWIVMESIFGFVTGAFNN